MAYVVLGFWVLVLVAIIWLWVLLASHGKRVAWPMGVAVALWPMPFAGIAVAWPCLSGHCSPSGLEQVLVPALILGSPVGILCLLVFAAMRGSN